MKIGIDASRANKAHKTGTEWYSYYLIRWIAKMDDQNEYILYVDKPLEGGLMDLTIDQYQDDGDIKAPTFNDKGEQVIKSKYNNFRVKILRWPFSYLWTQIRMSFEMIFNKPDVLFIPSHTLPFIHPKKSVVTIHDIGFELNTALYEDEAIARGRVGGILNKLVKIFTLGKYRASVIDYLRWSTRFALKHAKKIITVSDFSKKEIVNFYNIKSEKIEVVHNGYNSFLYKKNTDEKREKEILDLYGIEKPYFFYVGRIEKKKNIPLLIESFSEVRIRNNDIHEKLVLVGDASFGYDETKYIITSFEMANEVIMPGWIRECHLPIIYSAATAFVFPSNYEGFGIPLLQAMSCEVPIIASNTSSIPEVVKDAALLVNPTDKLEIMKALKSLATNSDLREALVNKGKQRVLAFSWEKTAKDTLNLLKNIGK